MSDERMSEFPALNQREDADRQTHEGDKRQRVQRTREMMQIDRNMEEIKKEGSENQREDADRQKHGEDKRQVVPRTRERMQIDRNMEEIKDRGSRELFLPNRPAEFNRFFQVDLGKTASSARN